MNQRPELDRVLSKMLVRIRWRRISRRKRSAREGSALRLNGHSPERIGLSYPVMKGSNSRGKVYQPPECKLDLSW